MYKGSEGKGTVRGGRERRGSPGWGVSAVLREQGARSCQANSICQGAARAVALSARVANHFVQSVEEALWCVRVTSEREGPRGMCQTRRGLHC